MAQQSRADIKGIVRSESGNGLPNVSVLLKNEKNNHRLMQIDLDLLASSGDDLEDVFDIIAVEMRRYEENISWETAKQQLNDEGKL